MATLDRGQIFQQIRGNAITLITGNLGIPLMLMIMLGMMTLPLPPFLLDTFFTFNIAISIVVLLICVYAIKPLDFAVFPSILLIATLLRLALNVASTRVVLLEGHKGGDAAGKVIEAFGEVLIGGNYAVGLVVFAILMIINFVVVTKGAGRVAEVSARFTLDAMPGKQMAIDADLNAGLMDADQAKARRQEIAAEAEFYGSMDGASKFVKGDAIAGISLKPSIYFAHDVSGYSPEPAQQFNEGRVTVGLSLEASYLQSYTATIGYKNYSGGNYNFAEDKDFLSINFGISY
ncbi:MAG: DUF1302 family protein [Oleispira sp.]|nr:DUF1302 family protein [Oleispira sp.]